MKKVLFLFGFLSFASFMNLYFLTENAVLSLDGEQEYLLDGNNISFTLPNNWEENEDTTHDLSLTKMESNLEISVFQKEEVNNISAEELLNNKTNEIFTDVDSKSLIEKYNVNKTRNRTIYSRLYSATKGGLQKEYFLSVVEFDNTDTYVFVAYHTKEAYMRYNIDDIERLLLMMDWNGEETQLAHN